MLDEYEHARGDGLDPSTRQFSVALTVLSGLLILLGGLAAALWMLINHGRPLGFGAGLLALLGGYLVLLGGKRIQRLPTDGRGVSPAMLILAGALLSIPSGGGLVVGLLLALSVTVVVLAEAATISAGA